MLNPVAHPGRPMSPEIPEIWPEFVARPAEIDGQTGPRVICGVCPDDPNSAVSIYLPLRRRQVTP